MTAALITARKRMIRIATNSVGPFFCPVEMVKDTHCGTPKFYPGGYALATEAVTEAQAEDQDHAGERPPKKKKKLKQKSEELFS